TYGCGAFCGLGDGMTMTTRAKTNAVFHQLAPPRTGTRGRPRLKGQRIGTPTDLAATATDWKPVTVRRYGTTSTVHGTEVPCLSFGTWRTDPVRVILIRDTTSTGYDLALVTTDLNHPGFGRDSLLGSGDQAGQVAYLVQGLELDWGPSAAGPVD